MPVRASRWGRVLLVGACAIAMVLSAARLGGIDVPPWAPALDLAVLLATVGLGVFVLPSGVFARPILAGGGGAPTVAITFDDGPDPVHTRRVLDLLDARGHRGTFFVIGERAERHADVVTEIARRGHGLGNHSFHHSHRTPTMAPATLAAELVRAGDVLERAAGVRPRWFRPPVGLLSPPVVDAARRARLEIVGWSATARDGVARATVESALARLVGALRPGAILVLHDAAERGGRAPIAVEVLARLLDALDERGLRSVPLDELLG
jgi:peptidoglycan/xylan/chitin deacetylase (PgdA/CDA1 family)